MTEPTNPLAKDGITTLQALDKLGLKPSVMLIVIICVAGIYVLWEEFKDNQQYTRNSSEKYMASMLTEVKDIKGVQQETLGHIRDVMQYIYRHEHRITQMETLLMDLGMMPLSQDTKGRTFIQTPRDRAEISRDMGLEFPEKYRYYIGTDRGPEVGGE